MKAVWVLVVPLMLGCGSRRGSGRTSSGSIDAAAPAGNTGMASGGSGGTLGGSGGGAGGSGGGPFGGAGSPDARPVDVALSSEAGPGLLPDAPAALDLPARDMVTDQRDGAQDLAVAPPPPDGPLGPLGPDAAAPLTPEFHSTLPLSGSVVTTRRPTIGWTDPGGVYYFIAEICRDVTCTSLIDSSFSSLTTFTAQNQLPEGVVYWRVKTMLPTGPGPVSATNEMFVGSQTPHDTSMLAVPDFNRDGVPDVALAAEGGDVMVRLFLSGTPGPVELKSQTLPGPTRALAQGVDLNSDGYGDLLQARPGGVEVYYGGVSELVRVTTLTGGEGFGASLAGVGDVNGDGFGDAVIGSHTAAKAFFHAGRASGLGPAVTLADPRGNQVSTFADACQGVGDINGDGFGDVVVTGAGTTFLAFVYLGGEQGLTTPAAMIGLGLASGHSPGDLRVATAGDVNADGFGDVVFSGAGSVKVFLGSKDGLGATAATTLDGDYRVAAGLADMNGDKTTDVIVAPRGCEQQVKIFGGGAGGLTVSPIYTFQISGVAVCPQPLLAR